MNANMTRPSLVDREVFDSGSWFRAGFVSGENGFVRSPTTFRQEPVSPGPNKQRRTRPCGGADRTRQSSPEKPDSPAAFLESCRGHPAFVSEAPSIERLRSGSANLQTHAGPVSSDTQFCRLSSSGKETASAGIAYTLRPLRWCPSITTDIDRFNPTSLPVS
jgi:hypothetical protein